MHSFSIDEKLWFAEQVNKVGVTPGSLAQRFNICNKTITAWARKQREGRVLRPSKGRPAAISKAVKQRVLMSLNDDVYKVQKQEFAEKVQDYIDEEGKSMGIASELSRRVSSRTLGRMEDELNIDTVCGEYTTTARARATASLRNFVSHAVMIFHQLHLRHVPRELVFNPDGSCYTVGCRNNKVVSVKIVKEEAGTAKFRDQFTQTIPGRNETNWGAHTIKYYAFIGAMGHVFDPIFVI
jgi:transposase-like protein